MTPMVPYSGSIGMHNFNVRTRHFLISLASDLELLSCFINEFPQLFPPQFLPDGVEAQPLHRASLQPSNADCVSNIVLINFFSPLQLHFSVSMETMPDLPERQQVPDVVEWPLLPGIKCRYRRGSAGLHLLKTCCQVLPKPWSKDNLFV